MISPSEYFKLYIKLHCNEVDKYIVKKREIKFAIKSLTEVYTPDPTVKRKQIVKVANYDDPACRCAYLFLYAPLYTCMVQDLFFTALNESAAFVNPNFWNNNSCINICSLGGGPGVDIIGVLSALQRKYGLMRCSAHIIESASGWKDTFDSVLEEFQLTNNYGISENLKPAYFEYSYTVADLLGEMDSGVNKALESANLVTMVRFLSAVTCVDRVRMIRKIFQTMRHGAVVFIIDNAYEGYSELVSRIAYEFRMVPVFGPLQCIQYGNIKFNKKKYGSRSCSSTHVTVHFLLKPYILPAEYLNISLKPNRMGSQSKMNCHSSSASALFFGTSGYDSEFSELYHKSYVPIFEKQNELNGVHDYDSSTKKLSMTSGSNFDHLNKFISGADSSVASSSFSLKCRDNIGTKPIYKNSSSQPNNVQIPYLVTKLNISVSQAKEVDSTFNLPSYDFVPEANSSIASSFKSYDTAKVKPFNTDSNWKPTIGQMSSLTNTTNLVISKTKEIESVCNYPLYELFPQNSEEKNKNFNKLLSASVARSNLESSKENGTLTNGELFQKKSITQAVNNDVQFQEKTKIQTVSDDVLFHEKTKTRTADNNALYKEKSKIQTVNNDVLFQERTKTQTVNDKRFQEKTKTQTVNDERFQEKTKTQTVNDEQFQEKTETRTVSSVRFQIESIRHTVESSLEENITDQQECVNCSKLKKIKWLQKMCTSCNI